MKKTKDSKTSVASSLRQKAEDLMKTRPSKSSSQLSKAEALKLIHELEVYRVELELQNQELMLTRSAAQETAEKYTELFDFGPSDCFVLSREGKIIELNLSGSQMLGKERSRLKDSLFGFFVSDDTKPIFNLFLEKVFRSKARESCELSLLTGGKEPVHVHLTGIAIANEEQCLVNVIDISRRKLAEQALRKSEELYKTIFETTGTAMLISEEDTTISMINTEFEKLFGYSKEELEGKKSWTELLVKAEVERLKEYHRLRMIDLNAAPPNYEFQFIDKQGNVRDGSVTVKLIPGTKKTVTSLIDITGRKQAEKDIRYQAQLLENVTDAVVSTDNEFNIVSWNKAAETFYGWQADEVIGKAFHQVVPMKYINAENADVLRQFSNTGLWKGEVIQQKKNGGEFYVQASVTVLKDQNGNPKGAIAVNRDISDRKRMEEALRTSEAQLSNALQMSHASHWEYDVGSDMFTFNDNFYRIFRTTAEKVGGYKMSSADYARRFCHPDNMAVVGKEIREAIKSTDPNYNRQLEHRILYADGEVGYISVRFFTVKDSQGRTVGSYGVNQDITYRKLAEKALQKERDNYRNSMDDSPVGVRIVTKEGNTIYANQTALNFYGYDSLEELQKTPLKNRYTPESYVQAQKRKQQRENGDFSATDYEISIVRKDGKIRHLEAHRKKVLWDGVSQFQIIYIDITKRKQAEEALRESEEKYRNLFNNSEVGMFRTRLDGSEILEINKKYLEILNYTFDEVKGTPSMNMWANKQEREKMVQILKAEGHVTDLECELLNKQGDVKNCITSLRYYPEYEILEGSILDITDRKMAEKTLQESEEKYRLLIENMGEGVGIRDGDENFTFANQAAEKIFGVGPGELVGTNLQRFLSPENLQLVRKQTSKHQKGINSTYELEIISSNGDIKFVIVTATPNIGKNDEFLGAFAIFRDITQSRRAETMLRESESSLQTAQEIAKMGSWERDIVKQETIWSKNYFKILGFKPDEVLPSFELFRSRIHPDDVRFFDQIHSAIMKDGKPFSFKLRLIQTDGKILWIKTNISPVIVDDQIVKIKGVIIDIDEQKQAEEALYQSIVRYEELFENINSGVAVYEARDDGRDFIFKDFNRAAEKIDNDKRERLIGKNICEVRPGAEKFGLLDVLRRVWSTGKPESLPVKEYKDDRRSGWYENFVYKLPSGEIVVVFDDVSKQKLAEEELKQTHEMLKQLFRHQDEIKENERKTISREIHDDLGQLLSAIKIDLGWTRANLANREEVLKKIDGMNDLVSETIKSVQTIASDLRPGLLDDLGLVPAIEWYCQEFEKRTGIRCHLKLDDYESLDENRNLALYRILQEALTNVLRHANAKNINICLVIEQGTIFFEIIDDGTGMKPEIINSKKSLGLIGIRERLNQINGSLEITSTMNKGTRLRIMVPIN